MTHPVRGIKGSDLLGFDSTAVKNRIKEKNTAIIVHLLVSELYRFQNARSNDKNFSKYFKF